MRFLVKYANGIRIWIYTDKSFRESMTVKFYLLGRKG